MLAQVEKLVSSTFVPPHLLEAAGFGFEWEGASPAAILKKDKLRTRNQIMAATGFLPRQDLAAAQVSTMVGNFRSGSIGSAALPEGRSSGSAAIPTGGLKAAMQAQQ